MCSSNESPSQGLSQLSEAYKHSLEYKFLQLTPRNTIGGDGIFMKVFLNHVRKSGAEAMKVCEQDPPKSGVDLEGA